MDNVIIIRFCELFLKGKNRGFFEKVFVMNIEKSLKGIQHLTKHTSGRYIVEDFDFEMTDEIISRLKKVFGIHTLSIAKKIKTDFEDIVKVCLDTCRSSGTFKVETNRADKTFPMKSMEINAEIGARLLTVYPNLKVDVHNPDFVVNIDMRESGYTLIFSEFIKGAGGMPVGTAGKGLLLLSGGIDSPVAGHMIAKRGMTLEALHFHSYPYTNLQAKEKVIELAQILSEYTVGLKMNIVSVTHIQEAIHKNCSEEYMVTLLRRFMMRIAQKICAKDGLQAIITGESLGQVASQTIEGMTSSNQVIDVIPVLRPLVGFDKNEIIERSVAMGTFETSIKPFEDCCTVFLPKFPIIKPKLEDVLEEESKLDVDGLIEEAMNSLEIVNL